MHSLLTPPRLLPAFIGGFLLGGLALTINRFVPLYDFEFLALIKALYWLTKAMTQNTCVTTATVTEYSL
ncbi:hypothetical protein ALQ95_102152 [Pseudomonas syringae pv. ribicola]|uniref:Uncharacterized protein n=1 Tax=Pseudomonas syringae pv. ribicola TaxID=55398 RepID=A0A3M2VV72_PSESI|nr:hypothetical protein ALQ95_102152 [Pseudomonas syringae pv. ribicola]